jgi:hypothetical protein
MQTRLLNTASLQEFFIFPFEDPQWKNKFLLACVFTLASFIVPVLPWLLVLGYQADIMRRSAQKDARSLLPAWEDWGKLLLDGLKQFTVLLLVSLPMLILLFGGYALFFGMAIFSSFTSGSGPNSPGMAFFPLFGIGGFFLSFGFFFILMAVFSFLLPPALTHVAVTGQFGAAFRVKEWWKILWANPVGYLAGLAVLMGTYMLLIYLIQILYMTLVLCFLIPLMLAPISAYLVFLSGALFGTVYREGKEKLDPPAAETGPAEILPVG